MATSTSQTISQVFDALRVLRKHWPWIVACVAAGGAAAAAWTWTRPPVYEAAALIEVEPVTGGGIVPTDAIAAGTLFETHRHLLTSRPILAQVADDIPLSKFVESADPVSYLEGKVTVDLVPNTRILRLRARSNDPALAMEVANSLARVYSQADADRRVASSKRMLAWLQEQTIDLKAQVEQSELALIQYVESANLDLVETGARASDDAGVSMTGSPVLRDLQIQLTQAELELERAQADYTDEHPRVIKLDRERKLLGRRIQVERKRIADENKKRIRYEMLRRDAELNREMFANFMKEMKRVNVIGDDPVQRIYLHEEAVQPAADRPIAPRRGQGLLLGLLAGLFLGVGLAFIQESLDRTLKRADEIEHAAGLPVLATIHRKLLPKGQERFLVQPDGTWGRELEDFRTLRTNLRFARADGENRVLLVTSALPQEGKTTIVTNLAMVMGQAQEKILIVDADLRRPAVHAALGIENDRGLTNLLAEKADPRDLVRKTEFPNVYVVTAGAHAPNPPELLESALFAEALAVWREDFDRVVLDTPPVGSVVDPCILAPHVDGVALLVSTGRVEAERVRSARVQLENVGASFFGVVVNQLRKEHDSYYGQYQDYYPYPATEPDADDADRAASG